MVFFDMNKATIFFNRTTQKFDGITEDFNKQLLKTYPNVNVAAELNKMIIWLNSSKGKQRKGNVNFIMNWLNSATPAIKEQDTIQNDEMQDLYKDYLRELWKGKEALLQFNMK